MSPIEKARALLAMLVRIEELPPPPPAAPRATPAVRSVLDWLFRIEGLDTLPAPAPEATRMTLGAMLFSVEELDTAPTVDKPPRKPFLRWLFSIEKLD